MGSAAFPSESRNRVTGTVSALFTEAGEHLPQIIVAGYVQSLSAANRENPGSLGLVLSEIGHIAGAARPDFKSVSQAFATLATLASAQDPKNSCILLQMAHLCLPCNLQGRIDAAVAQDFQQVLQKVHESHPGDEAVSSLTATMNAMLTEQIASPGSYADQPHNKRERVEQLERAAQLRHFIPHYQNVASNAGLLLSRVAQFH